MNPGQPPAFHGGKEELAAIIGKRQQSGSNNPVLYERGFPLFPGFFPHDIQDESFEHFIKEIPYISRMIDMATSSSLGPKAGLQFVSIKK